MVTAAGLVPTLVAAAGWPVTTPRELVCVRKLVKGLLYGGVEMEVLRADCDHG